MSKTWGGETGSGEFSGLVWLFFTTTAIDVMSVLKLSYKRKMLNPKDHLSIYMQYGGKAEAQFWAGAIESHGI